MTSVCVYVCVCMVEWLVLCACMVALCTVCVCVYGKVACSLCMHGGSVYSVCVCVCMVEWLVLCACMVALCTVCVCVCMVELVACSLCMHGGSVYSVCVYGRASGLFSVHAWCVQVSRKSQALHDKALVNCQYSMATFSTSERKRRPKGDRYVHA